METETRDRLEAMYGSTMDTLGHLCLLLDRPMPGEEGFVVPEPERQDAPPPGRQETLEAAAARRAAAKEAEKMARLGMTP